MASGRRRGVSKIQAAARAMNVKELQQALIQADNAGDVQAAQALADQLASMVGAGGTIQPVESPAPEKEIGFAPEMNELSFPAFKAQLGVMSTGNTEELKGILEKQFGDKVSFETHGDVGEVAILPSGRYMLNKPGLTMQDAMRFGVDMAAFGKAGGAKTVLGSIFGNAATEAAIQTGEKALGGDFSAGEVGMAGAIAGPVKAIENIAGAGSRIAKGKIPQQTDEVIQAGRSAGTPVMTTDVLPPGTFIGRQLRDTTEKMPFIGTGSMREAQQKARMDAAESIARKYDTFSYEDIVTSLKTQKDKVRNAAGNVLENTGNKLDNFGQTPTTKTNAAITKIQAELTKPGVIDQSDKLKDLQPLIDALQTPQTFTTLKENRTAFSEVVDAVDAVGRSQLPSRVKGLFVQARKGLTEDMENFAKKNLSKAEFSKWKKANNVWRSEADKLKKTKLKNILDKGDQTPETVETMLFSQKPAEVRNLYASLTNDGRANARAAIISRAVKKADSRVNGFSPNVFQSELRKLGPQFEVFFKGKEKAQVEGLRKLLEATSRAQDAAVLTPTGQSLTLLLTGGLAFMEPTGTTATAATLGLMSRFYESPIARDALIKLASVPKGSTGFELALSNAVKAVNSALQAARSNPETAEAVLE